MFIRALGGAALEGNAPGGWRWFGLKVHARNVAPAADLEMHLTRRGYVGLCRLPGGETNVCGLFRSRGPATDLSVAWRDWLAGERDSTLRERLASADFLEDSFCSVAALQPFPRPAWEQNECCAGDALTMVPPVTGNGMSIAFETAALISEPLAAYSANELTWPETCRESARRCAENFGGRMKWDAWLQRAIFQPLAGDALVWLSARWPGLWNGLFERTR